jgi:hypothetical protein
MNYLQRYEERTRRHHIRWLAKWRRLLKRLQKELAGRHPRPETAEEIRACRRFINRSRGWLYNHSPAGRMRNARYNGSFKGRVRSDRYNRSSKGRERNRRYCSSPQSLEANRRYDASPKGQETAKYYRYRRDLKKDREKWERMARIPKPPGWLPDGYYG